MRESIANYRPKWQHIVVDSPTLRYIAIASWAIHRRRLWPSLEYIVPHLQQLRWQGEWTRGGRGTWRWCSLKMAISVKNLGFAISGRGIRNESAIFLFAAIHAADSPMYDPSITTLLGAVISTEFTLMAQSLTTGTFCFMVEPTA